MNLVGSVTESLKYLRSMPAPEWDIDIYEVFAIPIAMHLGATGL